MIKIQFRRDDDGTWSSKNPILSPGEPGFNTTTKRFKIGDGITRWNSLPYSSARTPIASNAIGTTGDICWDSNYLYVCVATDTWKRVELTSW